MTEKKHSENLIPVTQRSKEEARQMSINGGKKSGEVRAQKRLLKDTIEMMLNMKPTPEMIQECAEKFGFNPKDLQEIITGGLIQKAISGDSKAFEVLRDTVGQKPKDIIESTNTNTNLDIKDEATINKIIEKAKKGR